MSEKATTLNSELANHKTQLSEAILDDQIEDIKKRWEEIIGELETKNSKIAHFLEEAILTDFDGTVLMIELVDGHRFHLKTLEKDAEQIALVINDELGQKIRIKFHIQEHNEDKLEKKKPESAEHPLFMKVLETFDGEIIR